MSSHSEEFFYLIDHQGHRRVPVKIAARDGRAGYAIHPKGKGNDSSAAEYTEDEKRLVQAVVLEGLLVRCRARTGPYEGQQNTLGLSGRVVQGYWLSPDLHGWISGTKVLPKAAVHTLPAKPSEALTPSPKPKSQPGALMPAPESCHSPVSRGEQFRNSTALSFADHCCQGGCGGLPADEFSLDDLTLIKEGKRRLRFAPLGNQPAHPVVALVGITPGGQVEQFAKLLATQSVQEAARNAAFNGAQLAIKNLVDAHGLSKKIGVVLDGDFNDSPHVLTTSIVKCCLMVNENYRFSAPDIAESPAATHCATRRFVDELLGYPTLKWVLVFGEPGWAALHELQRDGHRLIDILRGAGLIVLQLPHFAQNFQQRAIFIRSPENEAKLLLEKPEYEKFAPAARRMKAAVLASIQSHD